MKLKIIREKVLAEKGLGVLMTILVKMLPHYKESEKIARLIPDILSIIKVVLEE